MQNGCGHPDKGWFLRVRSDPRVQIERAGTINTRRATTVSDPATERAVNEAFAAKYSAADWIVALSGDASKRVPVRLDPAEPLRTHRNVARRRLAS